MELRPFMEYIADWYESTDEQLQRIEKYAHENHVPIMDRYGLNVMLSYMSIAKHKHILEIGTAIGYSAICMCLNDASVKVTTIERNQERYEEAKKNVAAFGLEHRIRIIKGDALTVSDVAAQHGPFDALFIDAAKGQYTKFFELYTALLGKDAIVYTDNVLFKGYVMETDEEKIPVKQLILVKKIRTYNEWLRNHPKWTSVLLPVGDGLFVSRETKES
ncbi:MAG: O-methyltransferase [Bacilli bacterium]